jgi:hypothetical protein
MIISESRPTLTRWPSATPRFDAKLGADPVKANSDKKEKDMQHKEDAIVDIPEDRLRFFGGAGKMLLPGPATVAALIEKVPAHKLITTNLLCQKLTQQFNVRGTCPVTTQKALQAVAHDPSNEVAYWRVIKVSGGLITQFPGGAEGQAERLRKEGFTLDRKGKVTKVKNFRESLVRL